MLKKHLDVQRSVRFRFLAQGHGYWAHSNPRQWYCRNIPTSGPEKVDGIFLNVPREKLTDCDRSMLSSADRVTADEVCSAPIAGLKG